MRAIACLSLVLALMACDSQAGVAYRGEPLLSMTGSVELADERPDGPLVPALAFLDEERGFVYFVDVAVAGEFPAEFSIDVFEPPPDEAFVPVSKYLDEPRAAGGYITAVVEDHPASVRLGQHQGGLSVCSAEACRTEESWCTVDLSECYVEIGRCSADSNLTDCVIDASGDPALKEDAFDKFAGFSENYRIVYLKERVPSDSYIARLTASPQGLEAGYHLFELGELSEAELAEQEACWTEAAAVAVEQYNDEHGSDFAAEAFLGGGFSCGMVPVPACSPGETCETPELDSVECPPSPDQDAMHEFGRLNELARLELDCPLAGGRIERVADPASEPIAVRIGMDSSQVTATTDRQPASDP